VVAKSTVLKLATLYYSSFTLYDRMVTTER